MNRLTIKNPFGYNNYKGIDITATMECINKLGQLEDIEEELGIDLITLFKALENGIYVKDDDYVLCRKHLVEKLKGMNKMQINERFYDKLLKTLMYAYLQDLQLKDHLSAAGLDTLITLKLDGYDNVKLTLDELIDLHKEQEKGKNN